MAMMKKEQDGEHPKSHYLVTTSDNVTDWHLRVMGMDGKPDHTLMGAAWAALHGGYRGNKYEGPGKEAAIGKLKKMYHQEGMPMPESKMYIHKDKKGQSWFVGIYSNNFEDRDDEIFTWESHLEYAKWLRQKGIKLPITTLHQPKYPVEIHLAQFIGLANGTFTPQEFSDNYLKMYAPYAFAQTEAVIPVNGFTMVIGKILTGKEKVVQLLSNVDWGMSHGFLVLDREADTIEQYRTFEFTTLPRDMAANVNTLSTVKELVMESKGMSEEDREVVKQLLETDPANIEQATLAAQEVLKKVLDSKQVDEPEEPSGDETPETEEVSEYEQTREKIFKDLGVEQLQAAFTKITDMLKELDQRLVAMDARVKQTERSEDEKVAAQFYSPNWAVWDKRTEEPNLEELKENALGDKPIQGVKTEGNKDNPLDFGWMKLMGWGNQ